MTKPVLPEIIQEIYDLNPPKFIINSTKPRQTTSVFPFIGYELCETPDLLTRESYLLSSIETHQRKAVQASANELFNKVKTFTVNEKLTTSPSAIIGLITRPENVQVVSKISKPETQILKTEEIAVTGFLIENDQYIKDFFAQMVERQERYILRRLALIAWSRSEGKFDLYNELGNMSDAEFNELSAWVDSQISNPDEELELTDEEQSDAEEAGKP